MPLPRPPIHKWCFALGHAPALSAAEIAAFFSRQKIKAAISQDEKTLFAETADNLFATDVMKQLGGTIKIGEKITGEGNAEENILNYLKTIGPGKIIFSINNADERLGLKIKKILRKKGLSARYVEPKNTATIIHNKLVEKGADFTVFKNEVYLTRAVQPIEELGGRDYGRPGRDDLSGMLPPKLAMMMINLAEIQKNETILDPFCGSGTILTEAMLMGYKNIIGADMSEKAVEDSKKNVEWIAEKYQISNKKYQIKNTNIQKIGKEITANSIDAVVTEPYLGAPLTGRENRQKLQKQLTELKPLYLEAFRQFKNILKSNGKVVIVIPSYIYGKERITMDLLPEIKKLGFAPNPLLPSHDFLLYHRPGQFVGREIWRFKITRI